MKYLIFIFTFIALNFSSNANDNIIEVEMLKTPYKGSTLFVPKDGEEKHPAVIFFHGSEGGMNGYVRNQARYLARQGYLTLFYCYFECSRNAGNNKEELANIELTKSLEAFNWLKNHSLSTGKAGIYGVSRGAEKALLLTSLMQAKSLVLPEFVAAHAPSDVIHAGFNPNWKHWMCWIHNPHGETMWDENCGTKWIRDLGRDYPAWLYNGEVEDVLPRRRIEIENYKGPIFISHGTKDEVWSVDKTKRIEASILKARAYQVNAIIPEIHYFEGEKHGFSRESEFKRWGLMLKFFKKYLY